MNEEIITSPKIRRLKKQILINRSGYSLKERIKQQENYLEWIAGISSPDPKIREAASEKSLRRIQKRLKIENKK